MRAKTYKEQFIDRITKEILKRDKLATPFSNLEAHQLRVLRMKCKLTEAKHFIPCRFPSSKFLSIALTLRSII